MRHRLRTLAVGTCRVAGPVELLNNSGVQDLVRIPHHFHYPAQVLQNLKHYNGTTKFDSRLTYLISEDAIRKSATREGYVQSHQIEIRQFRWLTKKFDRFIIELSALNEVFIQEKEFFAEYFARRDLGTYQSELAALAEQELVCPISPDEVITRDVADQRFLNLMREIHVLVGKKPILWVSHFQADAPPHVVATRERCINLVRKGAMQTKTLFFDPSHVIREMGQANALKDDGLDLAHFTDSAASKLSDVYRSWLEKDKHPWIEDYRPMNLRRWLARLFQ